MKQQPAHLLALLVLVLCGSAGTARAAGESELAGLWAAKRNFTSDVRGTLLIVHRHGTWKADIAGKEAQVTVTGDAISLRLPDGKSSFLGKFSEQRKEINGHWLHDAGYASPVRLTGQGLGQWRGSVVPFDDTLTFYLTVNVKPDGSNSAFLRNPERDLGSGQLRIDRIERDGETVRLMAVVDGEARLKAEGRYDATRQVLSVYFPTRGGTYDFRRVKSDERSDFYPRGRPTVPYVYAPPPALSDGWPTASLEDVGMSRAAIEKFIQKIIDMPMDSVETPEIHAVLVARHGKLVLEEYFHGEYREKPHDVRSGSKTLTSILIGAAMHNGVPVQLSTPVYQVMNGGVFPENLEPAKRAITLQHLLTMTSGLDCNEEDEASPGFEDTMWEKGTGGLYAFTMSLKSVRKPGEIAWYCSGSPNLAAGVLSRSDKRPLVELMTNLVARPLQIERYYMATTPAGDYYGGGGARFFPRDFMKLAQMHLNGGVWKGKRIVSEEWVRLSTTSRVKFYESSPAGYGFLWWTIPLPYKERTVHSYFASGLGGQISLAIPELDMVVGFHTGSYGGSFSILGDYIAKGILAAVEDSPRTAARADP